MRAAQAPTTTVTAAAVVRASAPVPELVALCLASCVVVAFWAVAIPSAAPFEYVEGDTATWSWLLRHGADLYATRPGLPLHLTNYPPLYLRLLAWLAPSDDALLLTGRLVSLGAYLAALGLLGACAAVATRSRRLGWLAALVAAHVLRADVWGAACRPDALAFALGVAGVAAASLRVRGWPVLAAALFGLSLATKQSFVLFPVGVASWALWADRRRGVVLGTGLALAVAALLAQQGRWDALVRHSIAGFRAASLLDNLGAYVAPSSAAIGLALLVARRWRSLPVEATRVLGPWASVLLWGLPWTASLGRVGSAFNYLLEFLAAATVLATAALAEALRAERSARARWVRLAMTAQVAAAVALTCGRAHRLTREVSDGQRQLAAARAALSGLTPAAAVLAEQTYWATASGRAPLVIPFLATQMAARGTWDEAPLVAALGRGEVGLVLLEFALDDRGADTRHHDRVSPAVQRALQQRYRLVRHVDGLFVYAPREAGET